MSVFATVADLVRQIREARQPVQGGWSGGQGLLAWMDERGDDRVVLPAPRTAGRRSADEWASHPAVFLLDTFGYEAVDGTQAPAWALPPEIAFAGWVLGDGALDAVLAAEVDPEYARAAHRAGVTDAWQLIEAWESGIPVEFLSALAGPA